MIQLGIVDDKAYLRESLKRKLYSNTIHIAIEAASGEDFITALKNATIIPDIVLMDIEMKGMDGIKTVAIASALYPTIKFIMLTVIDDDDKIFAAIKAGACGYLLKDEDGFELLKTLSYVMENDSTPMSPSIARKTWQWLSAIQQIPVPATTKHTTTLPIQSYEVLTEKETTVLQLCMEGKNYKKIADAMYLSPHTIRQHMKNIYKKLHVNNKVEAIRIGLNNKWIG
ncbi:MAG: response regulator transcription factor [Chitinophagaceae bacterium]|nr:response regulator transcription factor [Chitinophagaceae bacterium]MCW5904334.1 response regulator transcription factor [Chitinophagaceae bacterium]